MARPSKQAIRKQLLAYAWLGTPEEQAREVECILNQDDWRYVDAQAERARAAEMQGDAVSWAVSALYECHDAPHIRTCPHFRP